MRTLLCLRHCKPLSGISSVPRLRPLALALDELPVPVQRPTFDLPRWRAPLMQVRQLLLQQRIRTSLNESRRKDHQCLDSCLTSQRRCLPKPKFCWWDSHETHYINTLFWFMVAAILEGIFLPVQRAHLAGGKWVPARFRKADRFGDRIRSWSAGAPTSIASKVSQANRDSPQSE